MAAPSPSASALSGPTTVAASPPILPQQQLPSTTDQPLSANLPLNPNNPNPNPNPSPSSSVSDLMELSQPQSLATAAAAMQRPGSGSRLNHLQFAAGAGRAYSAGGGAAGQMSFGNMGLQQQQHLLAARAASMGGLTPMQAAMGMGLTQRHKVMAPGSQLNTPNMMQPFQGLQSMGTMGNAALNSSNRANGPMLYNQQAFSHGQVRAQQLASQTMMSSSQKMAGQGLTRAPLHASLDSPLSSMSQNGQPAQTNFSSQQQPWLKQMQTAAPGSASPYHIQQQPVTQKQMILQQLQNLQRRGFSQQQILQIMQSKSEVFGQQHSISQQQGLNQQQLALQQMQHQQQQSPRISGLSQQKSFTGPVPETPISCGSTPSGVDGANQLLGKRKIQDLVSQIDPNGRLDPEVEDLLLEIADEFIDSVTTFACSLAKHRKSSVLEAKDVLLHLEKNWNLTIPGFSREDKAKNSLR